MRRAAALALSVLVGLFAGAGNAAAATCTTDPPDVFQGAKTGLLGYATVGQPFMATITLVGGAADNFWSATSNFPVAGGINWTGGGARAAVPPSGTPPRGGR